ncbi:helix-turn-helix domain-containing protein [Bosea sp. NPDC055332]
MPLCGRDGYQDVPAANLRRLQHERRLTQEDLAERAGISSRYAGAIERADVSASVTIPGQIAEALIVEPCKLLSSARKSVES